MRTCKIWTKEEDLFLKENYPQKGAIWCARQLLVKKSQVSTRVEKLEIRSDRFNNEKNEQKFIELVRSKNGEPLWNKWLGTHHKHLIKCNKCECEWNCYPVNVIKKNKSNWCPECAKKIRAAKKRKCSESDYHILADLHGAKWMGKIVPNAMKVKTVWMCKIGHRPFQTSYQQIVTYGHLPCPDCKHPWIGQTITKLYFEKFTGMNFSSARPNFLKYKTGSKLELDGFNENLLIAFEYNGLGHYIKDARQSEKDFIKLQERDSWKYSQVAQNGIKLLIVKEAEIGPSPEAIRNSVLNFIIENNLPLVENFKDVFINPAEIYLVDPRKKVAEEAQKLGLILTSDLYISRNSHIPFKCMSCKLIRSVTPYDISVAVRKGKTVYCPNCSNKVGSVIRKRRINGF